MTDRGCDNAAVDDGQEAKLVVGLGNPGRKYADTRHNVGFRVIGELHQRWGGGKAKAKFQGEIADARIAGARVWLLMPHTFMNKSGASVLAAKDFYKLEAADILIVCDDFQLSLGSLRARPQGSAGGQKGLNDVIRRLGTQKVPRLRLGIGMPPDGWDVADYVLSRFRKDEQVVIEETIATAADAVKTWATRGMEACMNSYNRTQKDEP